MKIGQVEFTWRAHRQACVVKIGGEQRVFRFNKKTTRKELFAKMRSLKLRVSKSTVSAYLPYTKGVYLGENPSSNALKIRKCRAKNG